MFGISAFAQTPFSSLAGISYEDVVTEAITLADTVVGLKTTSATITESISSCLDASSVVVAFISVVSEGLTLADSPTGNGIYPINILESITLADIEAAVKIHNATAVEPVNVADVAQWFGFGTIDNTQDVVWVPIDNRQ